MSYQIKIEKFQGPFNLLLQLIEKEKLDITEISLAQVADKFLKYINQTQEIKPQELADFLEIATKLLLIKSRLLVPGVIEDEEDEQGLVNQLKIYRQYAQASKRIEKIVCQSQYSFSRDKIFLDVYSGFSPDIKITTHILEKYFRNFVDILSRQIKINKETFKRKVVSLRAKVTELLDTLKNKKEITFNDFIRKRDRSEKVVLFLATLELMRKHRIIIHQDGLFKEIIISKLESDKIKK